MPHSSERLRQELAQRLQQRLNPQSVALGRVLEMTTPEFEDEIRRELDDNPALEAVEEVETSPEADDSGDDDPFADDSDLYDRPTGRQSDADPTSWAADDGDSIYDILMHRLAGEAELDSVQMRIAAYIIGNLDSNGYLMRSPDAIADDMAIAEGIDVGIAEVRQVLDVVRALEPAGIAAVDLRDCLLLQLDRRTPTVATITAREIIANYFDLFSKMHYDRLQGALDISRQALSEALDVIRSLNPKPASALDLGRTSDRARHIVPDFNLDYDEESGKFTVTLTGRFPELTVEESFSATISDDSLRRDDQARAFIKRKREDALGFINLVQLRSLTLLSIARAIVQRQRAFFISADKADIRPMILKDIASDTGFDLSVISRASAGKYISTPHGIYPLKLFFNERPDADTDVSSHQIIETLADMIKNEDKRNPLSDRELTDMLAAKGYDIARRTVAKYREKLGLPVARLRKTY